MLANRARGVEVEMEKEKEESKSKLTEIEVVQSDRRRASVSSSINSSTASVRRRLAFIWRCCRCCFCVPCKCCRSCCCHSNRCCCGCCCHEFYHRKTQTDGLGFGGGGSLSLTVPVHLQSKTSPVAYDVPPHKADPDTWSYIVMSCVDAQWQREATQMGMEQFINKYPDSVLKRRTEVPGNFYPAYDELTKLWKHEIKTQELKLFLDSLERKLNPSPEDELPKSAAKPNESNEKQRSLPPPYSTFPPPTQTTEVELEPFSSSSTHVSDNKSTCRVDRNVTVNVKIESQSNTLNEDKKSAAIEKKTPTKSQETTRSVNFTQIQQQQQHHHQHLASKTVTSEKEAVAPKAVLQSESESESGSSEEEEDSDEDEDEEESEFLTTKKITRIIRVDPDGQRKEFVYEGEGVEDTEKLIEKAIADSPFNHQDNDDYEPVKTSTRRVVLKKQVVKRTVIKEGGEGEEETVIVEEKSEKTDSVGENGSKHNKDDDDLLAELEKDFEEY